MVQSLVLCIFALLLSACATVGEQTRAIVQAPPPIPRTVAINTVPFVNQTRNFCGPSTLAMVMQWAGQPVSVDQLAPQVYTAGGKGSLQADLISASRRHGLMAIPVQDLATLLKEIAAGHPVIVLENLGFNWSPRWHYSVVLGYDLDQQELIRHSGETPFKRTYLNYFERGWKQSGYWGLVVLPPTELSSTANELAHLQAAVGLEQAGRTNEAAQAYGTILRRWPNNLAALIGLGNVAFKEKNYTGAVAYLKKAVELYPESNVAKRNLLVAEAAMKHHAKGPEGAQDQTPGLHH